MSERAAEVARASQLNQQAEHLIDRRNLLGAELLLRKAIESDPQSAIAWNNLGRTLNNLRRLDEAEAALRRAVELDPDMSGAWFNLGHVQRTTGNLEQAEFAARRVLSLDESPDTKAVRLLASLRLLQGDAAEAIDLLHQAQKVQAGNTFLLLELGDALRAAERFEEAKEAYRECLRLDTGSADALAGLGTVHHACLEFESSIECFRQALDSAPGHPVAETGLALVLQLNGDYQQALDHVQSHLGDEDPGWAINATGRLLRRLDRSREAGEFLKTVDLGSMKPMDQISVLTTLAQVQEQAGEYGPAFESFTAANACLPSRFDPQGFRHSVDRVIEYFRPARLRVAI